MGRIFGIGRIFDKTVRVIAVKLMTFNIRDSLTSVESKFKY